MPNRRRPLAHRNLPLLLLQARERTLSRFRPVLNAYGLTDQQWRVLRALCDEGPLEPRQIGEICCISSPSMASMLARMQDMGLIGRERMPHDQRRVLVSLTDLGASRVEQMSPEIERTYHELESRLGRHFVDALYANIDHLLATLAINP
jgi:homoprotocatechuate degradation regulator HpaR